RVPAAAGSTVDSSSPATPPRHGLKTPSHLSPPASGGTPPATPPAPAATQMPPSAPTYKPRSLQDRVVTVNDLDSGRSGKLMILVGLAVLIGGLVFFVATQF
ncbi:MAG: hypothetical protein O2894_12595, partial [Planctomycetota bacterium]|nr:hypothetical protein [Planctomycetota bacterium]